ncbi:uncharacterized protein OCT59_021603 [Rhizophagus irregularis]|uniref:uncharacterized protein n=1 Tax=Rhizophagus irregularis TaxID=588596 RepID=UPI0033262FF4|nr:hypothetical protein OCT59_021603 [Rhizophagus irregularis]
MSNHATIRDIESRKKVVELENCNQTQLSLLNNSEMGTLLNNQEVNSFSSALMLASSVKINNIRSEEGEEDEDGKIKIREICE